MFLKRIQIPDFRVLKDLDLTFEPEFSPRIFPLESINGGGKSTLLQLIFILLSCSGEQDKHIFIQNMLKDFNVPENTNTRPLATIYLEDKDKELSLDFYCVNDSFMSFIPQQNDPDLNQEDYRFSIHANIEQLEKDSITSFSRIQGLQKKLKIFDAISKIENPEERYIALKKEIYEIDNGDYFSFILDFLNDLEKVKNSYVSRSDIKNIQEKIKDEIEQEHITIFKCKKKIEKLRNIANYTDDYLEQNQLFYICDYQLEGEPETGFSLLCSANQISLAEVKDFFKIISSKVFLAAPLSQIFIFLSLNDIKYLLENNQLNYFSKLEMVKERMSNFYTYSLLDVKLILESVKSAISKDVNHLAQSGEYGNEYKQLLFELNSLLDSKKININLDELKINFTIEKDGKIQELYPLDLSHGELKRLSIYMWLKYHQMQDCIVLIDEIENAFHANWQYQIISDLVKWGASNQYILATHSYELCQALNPAHIKELELLAKTRVSDCTS